MKSSWESSVEYVPTAGPLRTTYSQAGDGPAEAVDFIGQHTRKSVDKSCGYVKLAATQCVPTPT